MLSQFDAKALRGQRPQCRSCFSATTSTREVCECTGLAVRCTRAKTPLLQALPSALMPMGQDSTMNDVAHRINQPGFKEKVVRKTEQNCRSGTKFKQASLNVGLQNFFNTKLIKKKRKSQILIYTDLSSVSCICFAIAFAY